MAIRSDDLGRDDGRAFASSFRSKLGPLDDQSPLPEADAFSASGTSKRKQNGVLKRQLCNLPGKIRGMVGIVEPLSFPQGRTGPWFYVCRVSKKCSWLGRKHGASGPKSTSGLANTRRSRFRLGMRMPSNPQCRCQVPSTRQFFFAEQKQTRQKSFESQVRIPRVKRGIYQTRGSIESLGGQVPEPHTLCLQCVCSCICIASVAWHFTIEIGKSQPYLTAVPY